MKHELKHTLPVIVKNKECLHGGNQSWLPWKYMQKGGCGTIAGTDLLMYLYLYHRTCRTWFFRKLKMAEEGLAFSDYCNYIDKTRRIYFPIIPYLGTSGWGLAFGLNLYFRQYHLPYKARWNVRMKNLWDAVKEQLDRDIPVPLSVGQNVPFFFLNHKLNFYTKKPDGTFVVSRLVKAHFVTITGMEDEWLRITSWGKEFFVSKKEYETYTRRYSCPLVSNILIVDKR